LITLFDQELLLGLEITSEKTVFFYLGLFGTIMAVSRGMIPDQTESFDPELLLRGVVEQTHYMPNEWRDKLHTDEVLYMSYISYFCVDNVTGRSRD
jgi:autophagy-related protein 9